MLIKYPNYKDLVSNLLEFNVIRVQKLLHMSQNAVITAIFSFLVGISIDKLFDIKEKESNNELILKTLLQLVIIIIGVYYLRKLTKFIPFMLRFTESYNPFHKSKDGESLMGSTIAIVIFFVSTQTNLRDRIDVFMKKVREN